jgi:hypothetical protein
MNREEGHIVSTRTSLDGTTPAWAYGPDTVYVGYGQLWVWLRFSRR